jgi:hypothetical protein
MNINNYTSNQMKDLARVQQHLSNALKVASNSLGNSTVVAEAKSHIKSAIRSVEKETKKKSKRKAAVDPTPQEHWEGIIASVPSEPMSKETGQSVMKNLDSLINQEKSKLEEILNKDKLDDNDDFDISDFEVLNG